MAPVLNRPDATVLIYGNAAHPELFGKVFFLKIPSGDSGEKIGCGVIHGGINSIQ